MTSPVDTLTDAIFDEWEAHGGMTKDMLREIIRTHHQISGAEDAFEEARRALAALRGNGISPNIDPRGWIKAVRS